MAAKIVRPKAIHSKGRTHQVDRIGPQSFKVISGSSGSTYFVALQVSGGATCSCPWGQYRPGSQGLKSACSHVQAVFQHLESTRERSTSAWGRIDDAYRQHRPVIDLNDGVLLTSRKQGT